MTLPPGSTREPRADASRAPESELDRLRQLRRVAVSLFDTPNQTEVVEKALAACLDLLRVDSASFWAADDGDFVCQLATGTGREVLTGTRGSALLAEDPSNRTAVAPIVIGEATVGALRAARDGGAAAQPLTRNDLEILADLAESAGAALHAAVRAESAAPEQDLALVLEMSREIGSSLDLDRVLRSVVNLARKAARFDRGAVALYEAGKCDIRAVAGVDTVDPSTPEMQDLAVRAAWAVGVGQRFYLSDHTDPTTDSERIFHQIFGEDLEAASVGSGLYLPLKDEEGAVGILVFEAERPDFASEDELELLTILANQTTVAIRNAQLYARVPLADALSGFSARRRELMALPRRKWALAIGTAVVVTAALTLIRWPLRVAAIAPGFLPTTRAEVRAVVPGVVEEVLVREGTRVERGAPLARLRDTEARAERDAVALAVTAAEQAAATAASRRDAGEERLQRLRAESLRRELTVLDQGLALLTIRAPVGGVVLTPRPEERIDAKLEAGDALLLLGGTDSLELDFSVDQYDVGLLAPGAEVRLRVDAYPQRTFTGAVTVLGLLSATAEGRPAFPVRAVVPNPDGALRPGMVAQARVLTTPTSVLGRMLRTPLRGLRLFWWRLWSWS